MALNREQKQKIIEYLKDKVDKQKVMIFFDFTGLKVKDFSELRKRMKKIQSQVKVAKKTLLDLAFRKAGLKVEIKNLRGEIALALGFQDEISPVKTIYQFSQEHPNLKILGGFFEGEVVPAEKIIELAKLPSKAELLARLTKTMSLPLSNFVYSLQFNLKGLIHILAKAKI